MRRGRVYFTPPGRAVCHFGFSSLYGERGRCAFPAALGIILADRGMLLCADHARICIAAVEGIDRIPECEEKT